MEKGMPEMLSYDDIKLVNYISERLSSGNEVAIQETIKGTFIVYAAKQLFK
jgi:hypothetical protein